jgi:hypothetical protein
VVRRPAVDNFLATDHLGHVDVDVDLVPTAANRTMMSMQAPGHAVLGTITRTITEHSPGRTKNFHEIRGNRDVIADFQVAAPGRPPIFHG